MSSETQIQKYNLVGVRGDSWSRTINFKNQAGSPIDITGWEIFFTVKTALSDTDTNAVLQKNITSHTDPLNGLSAISFTAAETNNVSGKYHYDIQVKKSDGTIKTYLYGEITFLEDSTRRTS